MEITANIAFFALLVAVVSVQLGGGYPVYLPNIKRTSPNPAPPTTTPSHAGLLDAPYLNNSKSFTPSTKADQDFLTETCFNALYYKIATSDFYNCSRIYMAPSSSNDTQEEPMYLVVKQKFALKVLQFAKQQEKDTKRVKNCFKAHSKGNFTKKNCREFLVFPKFEIPRTPRETLHKETFDNMLRWFCASGKNMTKSEEALCRDFNLKRVQECVFTQVNKSNFCQVVLEGPKDRITPSEKYLGKLYDLSKELLRDPWMQY